MLLSPGASVRGDDPSIGAQRTSAIGTLWRLLSASDNRPSICMRPVRRHSSVNPSKATPRAA